MAFAAGGGPDLDRSWLKVEVSQKHDSEDTTYEICPSPYCLIGTAIEPRHRVIQVCVGAEHGVMRTDAGIAFTWGDNRYGQLGRVPVLKEENGTPFPVLDLLDEEVVQVAAGKNHCLALMCDGGVKSWGRNKMGQLGIGTLRDKVEPQWVCLQPKEEGGRGPALGGVAGDKNSIVTISAGGNSSIAAAVNADVWQWGELNESYKAMGSSKDKKAKSAEKDHGGSSIVNKAYPFKVASWKDKSFRTQMRKEKERVSISETLCLVMSKEDSSGKGRNIKDLADEDRRWRQEIAKEREAGKREVEALKGRGDKGKGGKDDADGGELGDLQDTIAFLERDIDVINRDIDLYEKNIQSCEQQQTHNRKQIEMLTHQATQLTESQGKYSQQMLENKKSGQQKKQLETQLHEIKDFIEANANTRATLLDQRAETDKEKQRLSFELNNRKRQKEEYIKRLEMVQFLGKNASNGSGASDHWVGFLGKEKDSITMHFEGKPLGNADILEAKKKLEKDELYLRDVESRMHAKIDGAQDRGTAGERSEACKGLLYDLVDLERRLNDLMADKYFKEDLNFECFFKDASKPELASGVFG